MVSLPRPRTLADVRADEDAQALKARALRLLQEEAAPATGRTP